ncbi:RAMP superfamily CRISPR-associated protein [Kyrpidia tusciae]|uniref:CRISPR type III-associated protein domain-containing protein n=1 Tax=Kyrpidia tusciae (strain DSM 2912 / NBRC 15312 / T2) TaxID=562970 RepID=D5WRW6_KYRT2|nr:RAMP superfamily CRISPR-associated protein [Kyrpidia tusciae]ADG06918.1 protein of unknown function DUF324 [Kyrpidia tusciae DSM 2912]
MIYKVIMGTLETRTSVHVGSGKGNELTDALIHCDADGRPVIPGTAIAGALRALLTRLAPRLSGTACRALAQTPDERKLSCSCPVCRLFGDVNPSDTEGITSAASRLLVFNARPLSGTMPLTWIRDGVGIERASGVAARAGAVKFDLEVLPPGVKFELRMELRGASEEDEQLLAAGLAEWKAERLWIGGRAARGLGFVALHHLEFRELRLGQPAQLMHYLRSDQPWERAAPVQDWLMARCEAIRSKAEKSWHGSDDRGDTGRELPKAAARSWITLRGTLQTEGGVLMNDSLTAMVSGFDHAPLLSRLSEWEQPVLGGAGIRGILRSHAERLARTLAARRAANREDFLRRCPACDPNARSRVKNQYLYLESCDSLLRKIESGPGTADGYLDSLCLACRLFGSPRRGSRLIVEDAPFFSTPDQPEPQYKMMDFLAIDRFTGGGVNGLKFDALVLWRPAFKLRLHLENPEDWELGWLALVLRDLADGWLTVGFGRAKGFGRVRLTEWEATFGYLSEDDAPRGLEELGLSVERSGVYKTVQVSPGTTGWKDVARNWVRAFHKEVENFVRPEVLVLQKDHDFDHLEKLYRYNEIL